jgi:cobalt/nickel transport system ATP-binding protein
MPVLAVRDLEYAYGDNRIFSGITFSIDPGESAALAGPNGAGKSTLLWCIAGLLKPRRGSVQAPPRGRAALVFQNPEDQLFMPSLLDDLMLPLVHAGATRDSARCRAVQALASMGLEDLAARPASQLSLGQRKRASIALALAGSPDLLILDEPTSELDGRSVRRLAELLRLLPAAKLISSHHTEFLRDVTDRTLILDGGCIAAEGTSKELLCDADLLCKHGLR